KLSSCPISFLLVLLLSLILVSSATAQEKSLYWDRLDVNITINQDGTFRVAEQQRIVFTSGTFTFGYRRIDMSWLEQIKDITIRDENGHQYQESDTQEPYTFRTQQDGNALVIRWYFPPTADSTHTYVIAYTVAGGLRYYDGGDQLWWKAVFPDRSFPVNHSLVTVHLPPGAAIQNYDAYFTEVEAYEPDASTVVFEAKERIKPGQELEVRVEFTHGVVAGTPAPWQAEADAEAARLEKQAEYDRTWRPVVNLGMIGLGLLFVIGGPVLLYLLWYTRGRDYPVDLVADYLPEPPTDLPAGVAGTLLDEQADMEDIVASIVDLARRGVIMIAEEKKPTTVLGLGGGKDFIYRLVGSTENLRPFEKTLIKTLFNGHEERRLSQLKNKFYKVIPRIKKELYQEVVDEGFFPASPERVRSRYGILGVALLVLTGILAFCLIPVLSTYTNYAICPALGVGMTAFGLMILARWMPRKTQKGSEAAARWQAFKRYLQNIEKYENLEEAKEIFDKYLPYAIAFGIEKEYVRKFAAVQAPAPQWYRPYPYWGPGRPYVGGGVGHGGRAPGPASMAPARGREGTPTPSLDSAAGGIFNTVDSMSSGLFSMLDSAASTLSSAPRSSSGGGGFRGGGFSGGGSSGGGGG
ncbi:MAG TPA: DUF2207 domain-containing protein, partial [Anaerolineae bacterium]|nr:DUF2207 domain-containing protein [Anaerolineae bacterium]